MASTKVLTEHTLNKQLLATEYAVRGEIVIKADLLRNSLSKPNHGLPFNEIISCNIGNPHELGQQPITFFRQVIALCHYPALLGSSQFPADAQERAKLYLSSVKGTGSYTNSQGIKIIRDQVAAFIEQRDGYKADPDNIFLTDGASAGVKSILQALIRDSLDGVLVPIPQYPLYSASLTLLGGQMSGYYLDESKGWAMQQEELERAYAEATKKGVNLRALVVINPGNPTGQCLSRESMEQTIEFCRSKRLVLMADEVYQTNVYGTTPFLSFKKVLRDMGPQYKDVELVSFHSVSKGFLGECGQRGGYMELEGIDEAVRAQLYKLASISLCSNTTGQMMTGLMVDPPKPGSASYTLYAQERDAILSSLKRRAKKLADGLNRIPGIQCNEVEGALYAFPQISLPPKLQEAARQAKKAPDTFYCLHLLQSTGLVVVPGSGFGQRSGTFHFRTTILPSEDRIDRVIENIANFHTAFIKQYQ